MWGAIIGMALSLLGGFKGADANSFSLAGENKPAISERASRSRNADRKINAGLIRKMGKSQKA